MSAYSQSKDVTSETEGGMSDIYNRAAARVLASALMYDRWYRWGLDMLPQRGELEWLNGG